MPAQATAPHLLRFVASDMSNTSQATAMHHDSAPSSRGVGACNSRPVSHSAPARRWRAHPTLPALTLSTLTTRALSGTATETPFLATTRPRTSTPCQSSGVVLRCGRTCHSRRASWSGSAQRHTPVRALRVYIVFMVGCRHLRACERRNDGIIGGPAAVQTRTLAPHLKRAK